MKWKTKWDITTSQQQQSLKESREQTHQKLLYMKVYIGFIRFYNIFRWVEKENGHCLGEMPKRKLVCHWILFVENRIGARDSKRNCKNSIWSDWFWIHIKKIRQKWKKFVMNLHGPYISMNLEFLRYSMSTITSTPNIQSK